MTVLVVDRDAVRRMVADGAQLVEVLPPGEYGEYHLPGAVNVPLKAFDPDTVGALDPDRPVITYCSGFM